MNFREYADLIKKVDPTMRGKQRSIPQEVGGGTGAGGFVGGAGRGGGGGGFARGSAYGAKGNPTVTESGGVRTINYNQNSSTSSGPAKTVHSPRVEGPKVEGGGGKPITSIDKDEMETTEPKKCWHRERLEKIKKQALEKDDNYTDPTSSVEGGNMGTGEKTVNRNTTGGAAQRAINDGAASLWNSVKSVGSAIVNGNPNRAKAKADGVYGKNEYFRMKLEELKKNN
jgi:hypothetical protein